MSDVIEIRGVQYPVVEVMPSQTDCGGTAVDAAMVADGPRTKMAVRPAGSESWAWWHEIYQRRQQ